LRDLIFTAKDAKSAKAEGLGRGQHFFANFASFVVNAFA